MCLSWQRRERPGAKGTTGNVRKRRETGGVSSRSRRDSHSFPRSLAEGAPDGLQMLHLHFLVFARHHDAVGAGGEGGQRGLIDRFRVVGWAAWHVEADAGVNLGLAVRAGDTVRGFALHVVGREAAASQFRQCGLWLPVVTEEVVIKIERITERQLAEDRPLEARQIPVADPW